MVVERRLGLPGWECGPRTGGPFSRATKTACFWRKSSVSSGVGCSTANLGILWRPPAGPARSAPTAAARPRRFPSGLPPYPLPRPVPPPPPQTLQPAWLYLSSHPESSVMDAVSPSLRKLLPTSQCCWLLKCFQSYLVLPRLHVGLFLLRILFSPACIPILQEAT